MSPAIYFARLDRCLLIVCNWQISLQQADSLPVKAPILAADCRDFPVPSPIFDGQPVFSEWHLSCFRMRHFPGLAVVEVV